MDTSIASLTLLTETSVWGVLCFWLRNGHLYCVEVKLVDRNVYVVLGGSGFALLTETRLCGASCVSGLEMDTSIALKLSLLTETCL